MTYSKQDLDLQKWLEIIEYKRTYDFIFYETNRIKYHSPIKWLKYRSFAILRASVNSPPSVRVLTAVK